MKLFFKIFLITIIFFTNKVIAQDITNKNIVIQNFIQDFGDKIISIASDKKSKDTQKKQQIINLIDQNIDAKWIAKFVLGSHYATITEEQKEQFFSLYRKFMINTYAPKFNSYNGKKFTVNNISKQSSFFLVKTQFYPRDNPNPINLDFRVKEQNKQLAIIDFIAEGISLLETQRSEFDSAIKNIGIEQFLLDLNSKINANSI
jgi:phospholipid transport system substrate-binding protein